MEENKTWFEPDSSLLRKDRDRIQNLAALHKEYKRRGFKKHYAELAYPIYRLLQNDAHRIYGCNLKRALRMYGCRIKVRHRTRSDRWVWMK